MSEVKYLLLKGERYLGHYRHHCRHAIPDRELYLLDRVLAQGQGWR